MNDLLTAASLMLAILGVLFGVWYSEITDKELEDIPGFQKKCEASLHRVESTTYGKVLPLSISAILMFLIFLPDACRIFTYSGQLLGDIGFSYIKYYDAVNTAFCVLVVMFFFYAVFLIRYLIKMMIIIRKLKKKIIQLRST